MEAIVDSVMDLLHLLGARYLSTADGTLSDEVSVTSTHILVASNTRTVTPSFT
jgi:hypothetical protein